MDDPKPSPTFGKVFSTTGKVLLALFLISLAIGAVFGIIAMINSASGGKSAASEEWNRNYYNKKADDKRTSMPLTKWNKAIAAAIKQHCPAEGMNKEEAEQAVGKPPNASESTWLFERTIQKECIKYDGDNCSEHRTQQETAFIEFSPNGHVKYPDANLGGWLHLNCFEEPFYSRYYKGW